MHNPLPQVILSWACLIRENKTINRHIAQFWHPRTEAPEHLEVRDIPEADAEADLVLHSRTPFTGRSISARTALNQPYILCLQLRERPGELMSLQKLPQEERTAGVSQAETNIGAHIVLNLVKSAS